MEIKPPERKIIDVKHPETERMEARLKQELPPVPDDEILAEWDAWEYEHAPKSRRWFVVGGLAAFALLLFSIVTGNLLFAVFVALASFVVYIYALRPPKLVRCLITPDGVQIGRRIFEFDQLKSFWIFYEVSGIKEISLESKKAVMPHIRIPLSGMNPVKIRQALVRYIPEIRQEESSADIIARILGF